MEHWLDGNKMAPYDLLIKSNWSLLLGYMVSQTLCRLFGTVIKVFLTMT